jgi:hypothetical protein
MDASSIIAALGGPRAVAELLGCSRNAVHNWRHDGIPARFWLNIIEAGRSAGVEGITAETVAWRPNRQDGRAA